MAPRITRSGDLVWKPWKTGSGTMADIVVAPDGAGLEVFDWRLSTARVDHERPFSSFPATDRGMMILAASKAALDLDFGGAIPTTRLTRDDLEGYTFPGDVPVTGRPIGGVVTNLNVMVARARFAFRMASLTLQRGGLVPVPAGGVTLMTVDEGALTVAGADGEPELHLQPADTLVATSPWRVHTTGVTHVIETMIWPR